MNMVFHYSAWSLTPPQPSLPAAAATVTLPGFGYSKVRAADSSVTVTAAKCLDNFYNPGSNALPCRRCPGGLITLPNAGTAGAENVRKCLAGPGYLFDKLVAKPCPRGTWKNTTSTATACSKCPTGLTTAQVASTSIDQCYQAMPGYRVLVAGATALKCARNYYNIGYNNATDCTICSDALVTVSTGSKSEASCVAPPGVGYDPNATPKTQACPAGSYKAGFNRKACDSCGAGFNTRSTGSDSKQRCYVPAAHGTVKVSDTVTSVLPCLSGLFGYPVDTFGVATLPCRACQAGMSTLDTKPGQAPGSVNNTSPDDCWTLPGWGYDRKAQAAKKCEAGTYNSGWNKEPCLPCGDGYTTAGEGALSASDCTIAPGWYLDNDVNSPVPCDEGKYCPGMADAAQAVTCPTGTTTSEQWAQSVMDCDGEFWFALPWVHDQGWSACSVMALQKWILQQAV
jgi:hypothetical protein